MSGPEQEAESPPEPDPLLAALYDSDRPPVELLPGVPLSPIIMACAPVNPREMLTETWIPTPPEDTGDAPPPPAFDPTAAEYTALPLRLSKSKAFLEWNDLNIKVKQLETEMAKGGDTEAKQAELENARGLLSDVEGQLAELKASFQDETNSLVPWMQTLFGLADAGMTSFDVSGTFWPYCALRTLFASKPDVNTLDGTERLIGTFKRRYERERGPNKIQVFAKLALNSFADGFGPAAVEAAVERIRVNVFGAESSEPLDLVQLVWWEHQMQEPLTVLKKLQELATDKLEVDDEGGVTIAEPKKVRALGLVDFPPTAVKAAIQAGVPITSVQISYSIVERSAAATLALCKAYGIKVFARGGTLGGLASEKYLGVPQPDATSGDADLDSVPGSLDLANNLGGWPRFQQVLKKLKAIADKHEVKVETVALRWQIDQGTFPVLSVRWGPAAWRQFGFFHWGEPSPGVDAKLFQKASFLDDQDAKTLNGVAFL